MTDQQHTTTPEPETIEALRESRDRLARAHIVLCEYIYGTKRTNAFRLVLSACNRIHDADLAAVRDEVWAEIDKLPDYVEPEEEDDDDDA